MITKLIIRTDSNSASILDGIVSFASDSTVIIQADKSSNAVYLSLDNFLPSPGSNSQPGIRTINQVSPGPWDGNFYLLGSGCTSVIAPVQSSSKILGYEDLYLELSTSGLGIFDGCLPCRNCQTIAQLQRELEECEIWINGLKDNNLYYEDTAVQLWNSMKSKVISNSGCNLGFSDEILNRQESLKRATKLLYQYKALIAVWNYLVRTKQGFTHIQIAPEDYAGFIVGSKRVLNNCGQNAENRTAVLRINIALQQGQNITYLRNKQQNIRYYVGKQDQNTYIQYGGDTGRGRPAISSDSFSCVLQTSEASDTPQIRISTTFTYHLHRGDNITLSGAVRVLPAIEFRSDSSVPVAALVDLAQWTQVRGGTKALEQGSDMSKNYWRIQSQWVFDSQISNSAFDEVYYFQTPYSKLGVSDSLSA